MSDRREQLLTQAVRYFLEEGVAETTLRPLAAQIGSSARLLVYHFGSKEGLLKAVMDRVQSHFQAFFADAFRRLPSPAEASALHAFWIWAIEPVNLDYFRLLFEVQALALQNPARYARYLVDSSSRWLDLIEEVLPPSKRNRERAMLCAAVFDGLLLEVLATGNRRRATAALDSFDQLLKEAGGGREQVGQFRLARGGVANDESAAWHH